MTRLYKEDGSVNDDGSRYLHRIKFLVEEIVAEASAFGIDLHDVAGLLHSQIDIPICKEILRQRKKREENG